jgi:hypothetical protein
MNQIVSDSTTPNLPKNSDVLIAAENPLLTTQVQGVESTYTGGLL